MLLNNNEIIVKNMQQRFKGMNSNSLKGSQLSSPQKQKAVDSVLTTFNENNLHKEKIND